MHNLTPEQHEKFTILFEECSEVIQAVGKTLRHGLLSYNPQTDVSNIQNLEQEIADVLVAVDLLCESELSALNIEMNKAKKLEKLKDHVHYIKL